MKDDENRNQMVDMLLREMVGGESPPDVHHRVMRKIASSTTGHATTQKSQAVRFPVRKKAGPKGLKAPVKLGGGTRQFMGKSAKRPTFSRVYSMAAGVIFLLGVLTFAAHQQKENTRMPSVTSPKGDISVHPGPIGKTRMITTGESSSVTLVWRDGTQIDVGAMAEIRFPRVSFWERAKTIELVKGDIQAQVAPQLTDAPLSIETTNAQIVVIGTKFTIQCDDLKTRLEVTEGKVRFEPATGQNLEVVAGSFAEAITGKSPESGVIMPDTECNVRSFTLMDADTDLAIRKLVDGESISLSALPSQRISIRSDFDGEVPASMILGVTRTDKKPTGIKTYEYSSLPPQSNAPFFVTGDYSSLGRSTDAKPWTPLPGKFRIEATPLVNENGEKRRGKTLTIFIEFVQ